MTWILGFLLGALASLCPWFMLGGTALVLRGHKQRGLRQMVLGFGLGVAALGLVFGSSYLYARYLVHSQPGAEPALLARQLGEGIATIFNCGAPVFLAGVLGSIAWAIRVHGRTAAATP